MTFEDFLSFFPEVELPITLSEEMVMTFSSSNKPFPPNAVDEWILAIEKDMDDLTEFVPCFKLANTKDFSALVYWKGSLMKYEFVLITFDSRQKFICRRSLASVIGDGDLVRAPKFRRPANVQRWRSPTPFDYVAGKPYVRKRERVPYAHHTDQSVFILDVDVPDGLATASLRAPA